VSAALSIERARTSESDRALAAHAGFALPGLATTAMTAHAGQVARAAGCFSWDRLERAVLPAPPGWISPGLSAGDYATNLVGNRLEAPVCWPFRQDAPLGDFAVSDAPKWWTHGQVHALIGGAHWPGLSEWELAHMARLSEAVASWHWYWLSELDQRYCDTHDVTTVDQTPDCDACRALSAASHDPAVRLERLGSPESRAQADNSLAFLAYEAHCFAHGLEHGELVVPEGPYLSMGEACDYARMHRQRLVSPSHARWLEACLKPGVDYATDTAGFAARAAGVARDLITPQVAPDTVARLRARRVLQDVGARLCHAAALEGDPTAGFERGLEGIAAGLDALAGDPDDDDGEAVEAALGQALHEAAESLASAPELGDQVLAVGYRPTATPEAEPEAMRAARVGALLRRAAAVRAPVAPLLERAPAVARALIAAPRTADLTRDAADAAQALAHRHVDDALVAAFAGWLTVASQHWGPEHAAPFAGRQWTYRLALRELPPESSWGEVRLRPNPALTSLPLPFDLGWFDDLQSGRIPRDASPTPRPTRAGGGHGGGVGYALMGQGRVHPILLACTPPRQALLNRLQHTPTLRELVAAGVTAAELAAALEEELVVALQQREPATLQVAAAAGLRLEGAGQGTHAQGTHAHGTQEDPGPWEAPEQAAYYDDYCQRTSLYADLAKALVAAADVGPDDSVVDLGCGTGVSALAALAVLGEQGSLMAIDPAPRMMARARETLDDPRVRFETGTARRLVQVGGPFDRVLCSSAIWLDPNILVPFKAAQLVLHPGGHLAFSIPAEFLGHGDHWTTPTGQGLAGAIQSALRPTRGDDASPVTPTPHPDYLGSVERLDAILREMGYSEVRMTLYTRPWTVGDYLDWLGQPAALASVCPGSPAEQGAFLDRVRGSVDASAMTESRWFLVVATT